MALQLPPLPYSADALSPFLSSETLELHHGKHHKAYVDKANAALEDSELSKLGLVELVQRAEGGLFNDAGQHFNHCVYWHSMAPGNGRSPGGKLAKAIESDFGSLDDLRALFTKEATTLFGSGWCWLTRDAAGKLHVRGTSNAHNPLEDKETPLLTCDVWEHAYYVDYRNARPDYVEKFWPAIDWSFAERMYDDPDSLEKTILGK